MEVLWERGSELEDLDRDLERRTPAGQPAGCPTLAERCYWIRRRRFDNSLLRTFGLRVHNEGCMERILVIDDDVELCHLVGEYLRAEGFTVECVHDGESGLKKATAGEYLLAVLDVMLPGINGFEVLRRIRATSRLPVLLLTARGEDVDRIVGLEIGADDYLAEAI